MTFFKKGESHPTTNIEYRHCGSSGADIRNLGLFKGKEAW
jgi:hypothetical protein